MDVLHENAFYLPLPYFSLFLSPLFLSSDSDNGSSNRLRKHYLRCQLDLLYSARCKIFVMIVLSDRILNIVLMYMYIIFFRLKPWFSVYIVKSFLK